MNKANYLLSKWDFYRTGLISFSHRISHYFFKRTNSKEVYPNLANIQIHVQAKNIFITYQLGCSPIAHASLQISLISVHGTLSRGCAV